MDNNDMSQKRDYSQIVNAIISLFVDSDVTFQDVDEIMYQLRKSLKSQKVTRTE